MENELQQLADAVAAALGPQWKRERIEDGANWRAFLDGPDHQRLFFSNTWGPRGMLHVSGSLPNGYYKRDGQKTSINVNAQKTAVHIAQDITRRLLPVYREVLADALEQARKENEYKAGCAALRDRLAALTHARHDNAQSEYIYTDAGRVHVSSPNEVRIEGWNLSPAEFEGLWAMIQTSRKAREEKGEVDGCDES